MFVVSVQLPGCIIDLATVGRQSAPKSCGDDNVEHKVELGRPELLQRWHDVSSPFFGVFTFCSQCDILYV